MIPGDVTEFTLKYTHGDMLIGILVDNPDPKKAAFWVLKWRPRNASCNHPLYRYQFSHHDPEQAIGLANAQRAQMVMH